jgi:hypothetical protein
MTIRGIVDGMVNNDSALLAIVSAGPAESYVEVLARLRAIEAELDPSDGLVWFTRVYGAMTAAVVEYARKQRFEEPVFVERLDCHFANLYFVALAAHLSDPGTGPACWEPLFDARARSGILPVQYAIAGVNAHINRDLPVALTTTFLELDREPSRSSSIYADYQKINAVLESALGDVKTWLLSGTLGDLDHALGQLDDMLQMWSLKRAREAAWVGGEVRWALRASSLLSRHHLDALDRMVGLSGRGLLHPLAHVLSRSSPASLSSPPPSASAPASARGSLPPSSQRAVSHSSAPPASSHSALTTSSPTQRPPGSTQRG